MLPIASAEELSDIIASDPAIHQFTTIYVTHADDSILTEIIDDKVIQEIPLIFSANYVVVGRDQLYMANSTEVSTLMNGTPVPIVTLPPAIVDLITHNNELYIVHGRTVSAFVNSKNISNIRLASLISSATIKGDTIYVMHGNTLSMIVDHKIVKEIELPIFSSNVFDDPARTYLAFIGNKTYLTEHGNSFIYEITDRTITPLIQLDKKVDKLAFIEQNLYVVHADDDRISLIIDGKKTQEIKVSSYPGDLAVVRRKLYVANYKGDSINVIADDKKIHDIKVTKYPSALATRYFGQSLPYMLANLENQLSRPLLYDIDIMSSV